jgi:hypothetical protein
MDGSSDSFSVVEYLSIFSAFIYGYVATRFFSGWGAMINFRHSIKFSKEHLFWTLFTFGLLIDIWWGSWVKGNFLRQYLLYYLSLLPPLVFYLISVLLFPPLSDDKFLDLKRYFDRIRVRNYLLFIALFITFEVGRGYFKKDVEADLYFNLSAVSLATLGIFSRKILIHYAILLAGSFLLLVHLFTQGEPLTLHIEEGSFSLTEYLTIFIAFIYGAIASRFFAGWGVMISKFDRITFSKEHLVWSLLLFGMLLDFWRGSWERERYITLNINYFLLSLVLPMSFFALTAVLFPVIKNGEAIDLRSFYLSHKKMIFLLFGLTITLNSVTANFMEEDFGSRENVYRVLALGLTAIGYFTRKVMVERMVLLAGCVMLIVHIITTSVNQ